MAFPGVVGVMKSGIPGTRSHEGPLRAIAGILDSDTEANNVFGRLFTYNDQDVETFQAGGTGPIAGIMISPLTYNIAMAGDGFLANGNTVEFLAEGEVCVQVDARAAIGTPLYYVQATGAISVTAGDGKTQIPGAYISRHMPSVETGGFIAHMYIDVTAAPVVPDAPEEGE